MATLSWTGPGPAVGAAPGPDLPPKDLRKHVYGSTDIRTRKYRQETRDGPRWDSLPPPIQETTNGEQKEPPEGGGGGADHVSQTGDNKAKTEPPVRRDRPPRDPGEPPQQPPTPQSPTPNHMPLAGRDFLPTVRY